MVEKKGVVEPAFEPEKTTIRSFSFVLTGEPAAIDCKNGRIVRIRPLHYDKKYTKEEIGPWKLEARGKTFETRLKSIPSYFSFAYKKHVYSPNRVNFPLKRIDWEPEEGKRNPQNRGISKYKRISWDEATDIIASEIKRVQDKYGPYGVFCMGSDGHHESKTVHRGQGAHMALMREAGGYTHEFRNADSWEGWYWGAMHIWGTGRHGHPMPARNVIKDISENTDMLVWQGGDPETTPQGFGGNYWSRLCYWFTELGIKQVWVCPDLNYGAAVHADKWIPVLPGTDAALNLAIIYTWITEGTYDKDYVSTHTVGFDKFADYVLGKVDRVPKTPEWASPKCGVTVWTIKALAREWAGRVTSLAIYYGGPMIRVPYAHETARLSAIQLGMQGLGKPGVQLFHTISGSMARRTISHLEPYIAMRAGGRFEQNVTTPQIIPRTMVADAILNPPITHWGTTGFRPVEDQFVRYTYPIPEEKGGTEVHMAWSEKPCSTACWNHGYRFVDAIRSPKIECYVVNNQWLQDDCLFADIILPVTTLTEEEDIMVNEDVSAEQQMIWLEPQAIEPIGESKSDYLIACEVAKKLETYGGRYKDLYRKYAQGMSVKERIKYCYELSGAKDLISWEELNKKAFYIFPLAPDWKEDSPGLRRFYEDPENNPIALPSGKLEFYSERLAKHFPNDEERGPYPKYQKGGPEWTHNESLESDRAKKYPLLMISNHGRWRVHAMLDDVSWFREIPTCKVKGYDGYMYEPVWLHPSTAAERRIKSGDIVKVYNERGIILGGAYVTERLIPGAAYMDHGARVDLITDKIDRGGSINLISPEKGLSKNCWGMAVSGYLVEVEKLNPAEMEDWRKKYPGVFERDYEPGAGLCYSSWVES